jgi:hypothetical protein
MRCRSGQAQWGTRKSHIRPGRQIDRVLRDMRLDRPQLVDRALAELRQHALHRGVDRDCRQADAAVSTASQALMRTLPGSSALRIILTRVSNASWLKLRAIFGHCICGRHSYVFPRPARVRTPVPGSPRVATKRLQSRHQVQLQLRQRKSRVSCRNAPKSDVRATSCTTSTTRRNNSRFPVTSTM